MNIKQRAQYRGLIKHATAKCCRQRSAIGANTEYSITDSYYDPRNWELIRPTELNYTPNNPRRCNETNKRHNIEHYSNTPLPNLLSKDLQIGVNTQDIITNSIHDPTNQELNQPTELNYAPRKLGKCT